MQTFEFVTAYSILLCYCMQTFEFVTACTFEFVTVYRPYQKSACSNIFKSMYGVANSKVYAVTNSVYMQ
jgi:hypothetical protein